MKALVGAFNINQDKPFSMITNLRLKLYSSTPHPPPPLLARPGPILIGDIKPGGSLANCPQLDCMDNIELCATVQRFIHMD